MGARKLPIPPPTDAVKPPPPPVPPVRLDIRGELRGLNAFAAALKEPPPVGYFVLVFKNGLVYDRQELAADISITTYIREMMSHGYGLEIIWIES